jgi:hypothetical protein
VHGPDQDHVDTLHRAVGVTSPVSFLLFKFDFELLALCPVTSSSFATTIEFIHHQHRAIHH